MIKKIKVLAHSSVRIQSDCGVVYVDPFHLTEEAHDASYILITHDHHDHFSPEDIKKVSNKDTILIVPESMKNKSLKAVMLVGKIRTVEANHPYFIGDLDFETIPAYNNKKAFHPKDAGGLGYILIMEGQRIYIAGDTDVTEDNKKVECDIALVPVGGTYTMDAVEAAELVNIIQPKIAVPTHYGDIVGRKEDAQVFAEKVDPKITVEILMK